MPVIREKGFSGDVSLLSPRKVLLASGGQRGFS